MVVKLIAQVWEQPGMEAPLVQQDHGRVMQLWRAGEVAAFLKTKEGGTLFHQSCDFLMSMANSSVIIHTQQFISIS